MGNRLSKIYTRTGDDGTTGLGDGSRTEKDGVRVSAYGTTDELNSIVGVVLSPPIPTPVQRVLHEIQHHSLVTRPLRKSMLCGLRLCWIASMMIFLR